MASEETEISAGDVIAGREVLEVADNYWGGEETVVFLAPDDSGANPHARKWVLKKPRPVVPGAVVPDELKRRRPTDAEGRPLLCPNCYGPDPEGYPIEVLEG